MAPKVPKGPGAGRDGLGAVPVPRQGFARWIVLGLSIAVVLAFGIGYLLLQSCHEAGRDFMHGYAMAIQGAQEPPRWSVTRLDARMSPDAAAAALRIPRDRLEPIDDPDRRRGADPDEERMWFEVTEGDFGLGPPGRLRLRFDEDELVEVRFRPSRDQDAYFARSGGEVPPALAPPASGGGRVGVLTFRRDENRTTYDERVWISS